MTIDTAALSQKNAQNRNIIITGNTKGREKITRLKGIIKKVDKNYIIYHTAATEKGNSGSPIVDLNTFKVLGILTWGRYDSTNPHQAIWRKTPPKNRSAINSGAGLATIKYEPSSFKQIYAQRLALSQLYKNTRIMGLMDALVPTKQGLFFNKGKRVLGEYTVNDILKESPKHPAVVRLKNFDLFLSKYAVSNIGISNQDMLKNYIACYKSCLKPISNQRKKLEKKINSEFTYFLKLKAENTKLITIHKFYEKSTSTLISWCAKQRGTSGQALPLSKRFRLPDFDAAIRHDDLRDE